MPCALPDAAASRIGGLLAPPRAVLTEARDEVLAGAAHAGGEVHLRAIAEQPLRLRDVGERVPYVPGARRGVRARQAAAEEAGDRVRDREQRVPRAAGDVEDLAPDAPGGHREQV